MALVVYSVRPHLLVGCGPVADATTIRRRLGSPEHSNYSAVMSRRRRSSTGVPGTEVASQPEAREREAGKFLATIVRLTSTTVPVPAL